jgi:GH18 family chitinase
MTATPSTLREAAVEVEAKLARWIDRHYMMEYPFHESWKRLHVALYGHEPKPALSPCQICAAAETPPTPSPDSPR